MCILFILLEVIIIVCYYDIPFLDEQNDLEGGEVKPETAEVGSFDSKSKGRGNLDSDGGLLSDLHSNGAMDDETVKLDSECESQLDSHRRIPMIPRESDKRKSFTKLEGGCW